MTSNTIGWPEDINWSRDGDADWEWEGLFTSEHVRHRRFLWLPRRIDGRWYWLSFRCGWEAAAVSD